MKKKLLVEAMRIAEGSLISHPEYSFYPHWTFVVQDEQIVEWGTNKMGDPPIHFGYRPLSKLHSELVAFRKARGLLSPTGWSIINVRLNRDGEPKIAAPCKTCWTWLTAVGCNSAWFTTENGWGRIL